MRNLFFLWLCLFTTVSQAIDLDIKHRVKNKPPGYCAWASLEALGRHHQIEPLYDLLEKRTKDLDETIVENGKLVVLTKNLGYQTAIEKKLNSLKVRFKFQRENKNDLSLLKQSDTHGCMAVIKAYCLNYPKEHPQNQPHVVLLTGFNETDIQFFDCNFPQHIFLGKRVWFDQSWSGTAFTIYKD